jgi:hypothetical protein
MAENYEARTFMGGPEENHEPVGAAGPWAYIWTQHLQISKRECKDTTVSYDHEMQFAVYWSVGEEGDLRPLTSPIQIRKNVIYKNGHM